MKNLSFNEMQAVTGGNDYNDGFCLGTGAVGALSIFGWVAITPVGVSVLGILGAGCILYEGYSHWH